MMTVEQLVSVQKSNVETMFGLAGTAFEGVEKLVELNLQVAKAAMSDAAKNAQAALSVKDAQELLALQASLFQPAAEKVAAYNRYVYEIASSTGAEVSQVYAFNVANNSMSLVSGVTASLAGTGGVITPMPFTTAPVSASSVRGGCNNSFDPAVSADGRFVAFGSDAVNLQFTRGQRQSENRIIEGNDDFRGRLDKGSLRGCGAGDHELRQRSGRSGRQQAVFTLR